MKDFDVFCIGKTTIDEFLVLNKSTSQYHLDSRTGFISFKHGEKIEVEHFEFCLGGNATNVAIGLSRIGLKVGLCSEIGDDEFGQKISNQLHKENVDRSYMLTTNNAPSSFSVVLNLKCERTIFMQRIQRRHDFNIDNLCAKYIFLTSLENEWRKPYEQVLNLIVKKSSKLIFNPGTIQLHEGMDLVMQVLRHTFILFVNKEEGEELAFGHEKRKRHNEVDYMRELLIRLKKMGPKIVVITNGRYGSHAIDELGKFYHEGLYPGEAVERTGAGDAYTSGFLAAKVLGLSIQDSMRWGAANSSSVIGRIGAVAGLLSKDEIEKSLIGHNFKNIDSRSWLQGITGKLFPKIKS